MEYVEGEVDNYQFWPGQGIIVGVPENKRVKLHRIVADFEPDMDKIAGFESSDFQLLGNNTENNLTFEKIDDVYEYYNESAILKIQPERGDATKAELNIGKKDTDDLDPGEAVIIYSKPSANE